MKHWLLLPDALLLFTLGIISGSALAAPQPAAGLRLSAAGLPAVTTTDTATATVSATSGTGGTSTPTLTETRVAGTTATPTATGSPPPDCSLTHWRQVAAPTGQGLAGVAAISAGDVWTVGADIYHWDGSGWQAVPYPSQTPTFFTSISA